MRILLMIVAFAALACAGEVEDNEQKKRGAGKTTTLNAIPTGAQKQEYAYIYSQNPQSTSPYQPQVPNSFYPTQGPSQYYASPTEASPQYPAQPQINLIPPQSPNQFVPLNFIPNPGYQAKYQLVPSKTTNGNIQLALIPQTQGFQSPFVQYPQLFSPNPAQQVGHQQNLQQLTLGQNYQLPFGSPYFGHPSMLFYNPPNPVYNNLLYQNPLQNLFSYYPTNSQPKYSPAVPPPSPEYEKIQGPVSQSLTKEDNDLNVHSSEYITSADNSNYKSSYNRPTYSKL